jgi:hypothetical protein
LKSVGQRVATRSRPPSINYEAKPMNHYAEDPMSADAEEKVRRAFEKATQAVALLRMYRTSHS